MIYPGLIREALYVWIKGWGVNNNQEGGWKIEKKKKIEAKILQRDTRPEL